MSQTKQVIYVMGVAGCGKTSIGKKLSEELSIPFFDADDFHSSDNKDKMSNGIPLNDGDRRPWLIALNQHAKKYISNGCVIACSALKDAYRKILMQNIESSTKWIYLHGSYELIFSRIQGRSNHYMSANMLKSQFDDLEEPEGALWIDIANTPDRIIKEIKQLIK